MHPLVLLTLTVVNCTAAGLCLWSVRRMIVEVGFLRAMLRTSPAEPPLRAATQEEIERAFGKDGLTRSTPTDMEDNGL